MMSRISVICASVDEPGDGGRGDVLERALQALLRPRLDGLPVPTHQGEDLGAELLAHDQLIACELREGAGTTAPPS